MSYVLFAPPPHTAVLHNSSTVSVNQKELKDSEMIYEREQPLSAIELKDMYDIYSFYDLCL